MIEAALTLSIAVVLFSLFDNAPQTRPAAAVRAQRGET
jgi:hypothetical protein